jgi:hypothetical protein
MISQVIMARSQVGQPQRSVNSPLLLGTFSTTSLRYLKGTLGPQSRPIGRADTNQTSNGGFGGGTYNHWFQINITAPAWIILTKGPPRPKYINVSAYELNRNPIQGEAIFQADSITVDSNGNTYVPYLDTVMSAQSDLYNQFDSLRLDRGDERYYPLPAGGYLVCVSTTRNEPLEYAVGIVIEFSTNEVLFELESLDGGLFLTEDNSTILVEVGNDAYFNTFHDHSLSEWKIAWQNEHQDTDRFPEVFVPLTNRP